MTRKLALYAVLLIAFVSCMPTPAEIEWVYVEGGSFEQGKNQIIVSPKGDTINGFTSPKRVVELNDFYISAYEITVAQFKAFCDATGRTMPDPPIKNAYGEEVHYTWQNEYPMLATWDEANEFAKWIGGRLPTEAEWEYAAKGGQKSLGFQYSGSDNPMEVGWVGDNSDSSFHKVGLLKPNELGLYDMTGNLSEWVSDWYNPEKDHLVNKRNPQGPPDGEGKISKGLSWFYKATDENGKPLKYGIHLPEVRYQSPIETRNDGFGFRVVKDK